ncbi:aminoacyl-tRNA hydrolase, partial [Flavobacteriaceae bacterium]|nr:aminoacyl-tRNA hydrolase [Flavobacteriaceae bacterium]
APLQFPIGTTQVIHTVTDIFGNSNSSVQNVTVLDTEIPLIQANDLVLTLNSDGELEIPFNAIDNGSTDNCTISTYNIVSKDTENIFTDETPIPLAQEEFQNSDLTCAMISLNGLGVTENGNIILPSPRYGNIISLTTDYQDYDSQQNRFDVVDIETERVITFRITIPDNFTNSIEEYIECSATAIQPIFGSTGKSSHLTEISSTKIKTLNSKKIVLNCGNLGPQQIIYSVTDSSGNTASTTVNIPLENILILTDEIHLPFGTIRIKGKGSPAGHNGLKDIENQLNTPNYARLRFGIGQEQKAFDQVKFVLDPWEVSEQKVLPERFELCSKAILSFGLEGLNSAMNHFNGK